MDFIIINVQNKQSSFLESCPFLLCNSVLMKLNPIWINLLLQYWHVIWINIHCQLTVTIISGHLPARQITRIGWFLPKGENRISRLPALADNPHTKQKKVMQTSLRTHKFRFTISSKKTISRDLLRIRDRLKLLNESSANVTSSLMHWVFFYYSYPCQCFVYTCADKYIFIAFHSLCGAMNWTDDWDIYLSQVLLHVQL